MHVDKYVMYILLAVMVYINFGLREELLRNTSREKEEKKERICSVTPIRSVRLTQYCLDDQFEKNEVGEACGMYGGGERCIQGLVG
jgi:hypothetical protein